MQNMVHVIAGGAGCCMRMLSYRSVYHVPPITLCLCMRTCSRPIDVSRFLLHSDWMDGQQMKKDGSRHQSC